MYVFKSAYEKSINNVWTREHLWQMACERAETNETVNALLEKFEAAKAAHRAQFGALRAYRDEFGQKNWI